MDIRNRAFRARLRRGAVAGACSAFAILLAGCATDQRAAPTGGQLYAMAAPFHPAPTRVGNVIEGRARVIDGAQLDVAGTVVQLWGIVAPKRREPGGADAAAALEGLLAVGRNVTVCRLLSQRGGDRPAGWCLVGGPDGVDVGREMVAMGWARVCLRTDPRYLAEEGTPKAARAGLWGAGYQPPAGCGATS